MKTFTSSIGAMIFDEIVPLSMCKRIRDDLTALFWLRKDGIVLQSAQDCERWVRDNYHVLVNEPVYDKEGELVDHKQVKRAFEFECHLNEDALQRINNQQGRAIR